MAGYKNPPKHSQFKKGTSGNPKGRPKGSKNKDNLADLINKEANSEVVLANGEKIIKKEAVVKNMFNNSIKSKKVKDSAVVINMMKKVELENEETTISKIFVNIMIRGGFLDKSDIDDIVNNRKDPSFNYPKGIHKIYNQENIKKSAAFEGVKSNQYLSILNLYLDMQDYINMLVRNAKNELFFWSNLENTITEKYDFNREEYSEFISAIEESRVYAKVDKEIVKILELISIIIRNNMRFIIYFKRDLLRNKPYYKEMEKESFSSKPLKKVSNNMLPFIEEELAKTSCIVKENYDAFMNENRWGEYVDIKDILNEKEISLIQGWFLANDNKGDVISYEEACDKFNKKYEKQP